MNNSAKKILKIFLIIAIFPAIIGLYFFDNIKGYYKFKEYCAKEGGLHTYKKLEKNAGVMARSKAQARVASSMKSIGFARYIENEQSYDVTYNGGFPANEKSYQVDLSDISKTPLYSWKKDRISIAGELRLVKTNYQLVDTLSKSVLVDFITFYYSTFERNKTLLAAPSVVSCHNLKEMMKIIEKDFKD
jgi:hypothetical protein